MARIEVKGQPRFKTKASKKVRKRTPGVRTVTHYKKKKTAKHVCAVCKGLLLGVPRGRIIEIKKMLKSQRVPERPFAGQLCSKCTREVLKLRAKLKFGLIKEKDIPLKLKNYVLPISKK